MSERFVGDESRQATAAIRGYDYQLWWSLYSWCKLDPREDLYLERAEDFDVVGPTSAEVVQVKDTSRTLTLTSGDALSAISNWWKHQRSNQGRAVHLRFLTTAKAGIERGRPFGDEPGVLCWERAKRMGTEVASLRALLAGREELPTEFREFVGSAPDEELRESVIQRISWDFAGPAREDVRALVEDRLAEICVPGYTQFVDDARRIAPALKDRLLESILKPGLQPLTRVRLLEAIEDLLTERRPRSEIRALEQIAAAVAGAIGAATGGPVPIVAAPEGALMAADTVLPTGYLERGAAASAAASVLARTGVLVIRGSSGMGKSRLALLVMRHIGGVWLVLDARGRTPAEVRWRLARASAAIPGTRVAGVLIDDLNFDEAPESYENELIRFLRACRVAHWNVLVSTQLQLPARVSAECDVPPEASLTAPPFSEQEVRELAELHGCEAGLPSERWAKVVHATTQGHPQLVHARVLRLKAEGWPDSDDSLFRLLTATEDLASVQREARRRLEDDLPSSARSLVYRLAVFTAFFTRQQALLVARVENAGEVFDRLLGPWIEGPTGDYYRLSPLLRGSAPGIMTDAQVAEVRRDICRAIVATRTLSPIDFAELVFQAFVAGYHEGLVVAALASFQMPREQERGLLGNLLWLPILKLGPGESLYPANPITGLLLRHLQFRVARATGGKTATIMDAWDREFAALRAGGGGGAELTELAALHRTMFLCDVLFRPEVPLEVDRSIRYGNELLGIARAHPRLVPPSRVAGDESQRFDFPASVLDSVVLRLRGPARVGVFLEALEAMPASEAQTFVEEFRRDAGNAVNLMMALFEADKLAEGDARALAKPIALAAGIGQRRGIPELRAAAIRTQAVVESEYLNNPTSALALLDATSQELGEEPPVLADYRATILVALGKDEMAVGIWRDLLPRWQGADSTRMFSARQAGMAASRLGEHRDAERFFAQAEALARQERYGVLAVGLAAERALALWRAGETAQAVAALARVLTELETLPDPEADLEARNLHKLVGHSILWMLRQTRGSDFADASWIMEPPPGRLSQSRVDERIRELPLGPIAWAWAMLAALEVETDSGEVAQREWERRSAGVVGAFQWQIEASLVRKALRNGELERLFGRAATLFHLFLKLRAAGQGDQSPGGALSMEGEGEFIADVLAAGVVIRVAESAPLQSLPLDQWRREAARLSARAPVLEGLIDALQRLKDGADPTAMAQRAENLRSVRVVAGALLARMPRTPNDLFLGTAMLVDGHRRSVWRGAVEGPATALIVSAWKALLLEQRFALQAPRVVGPAIEEAMGDRTGAGLVKGARILVAARPGVTVSLSDDFVAALDALARGETVAGAETLKAEPPRGR